MDVEIDKDSKHPYDQGDSNDDASISVYSLASVDDLASVEVLSAHLDSTSSVDSSDTDIDGNDDEYKTLPLSGSERRPSRNADSSSYVNASADGRLRIYDTLGSPTVLHRQPRTRYDEPFDAATHTVSFAHHRYREHVRIKTRWYSPLDYKNRMYDNGSRWTRFVMLLANPENFAINTRKRKKERCLKFSPFVDIHLSRARANMLVESLDNGQSMHSFGRLAGLKSIVSYSTLDVPYIAPNSLVSAEKTRIHGGMRRLLHSYMRKHIDGTDSAYVAPIEAKTIKAAIASYTKKADSGTRVHVNSPDDALCYGNTILTVKCVCSACKGQQDANVCLVHPVGDLQDSLRAIAIQLPRGRRVVKLSCDTGGRSEVTLYPPVCHVGDPIRQVNTAGNFIVVRTTLYIVLLRLGFKNIRSSSVKHTGDVSDSCFGSALRLELVRRIDLRTMYRSLPSYYPRHVTCNPRFGRGLTDVNMSILGYSNRNDEYNVVHQVIASTDGSRCHEYKHCIRNLEYISHIEHGPQHPMVLWAAGRSYVRPTPLLRDFRRFSRMGHGTALYSVDMRTDQGTFMWSPSAELYQIEGMNTISALHVDWRHDHTLYVASASAGKTWELDTRHPAKVVNEWSLPHTTETSAYIEATHNFFGPGMLMQQINDFTQQSSLCDTSSIPLFAVSKDTNAYGLHLYQRPDRPPLFGTKSIECAFSFASQSYKHASIAHSTVYPFPADQSSGTKFACGLSVFRLPSELFVSTETVAHLNYDKDEAKNVVCAITGDSKGDLLAYTMLELRNGKTMSRIKPNSTAGTSFVDLPHSQTTSGHTPDITHKGAELCLSWMFDANAPLSRDAALPQLLYTRTGATARLDDELQQHLADYSDNRVEEKQEIMVRPSGVALAHIDTSRDCSVNDISNVDATNYGDDHYIKLASGYVHGARREYETTLNCFARPEDNATSEVLTGRSDITTELLRLARDDDWNDSGSENDRGIDNLSLDGSW